MYRNREGVYWGENVEDGECAGGDSESPLNHSYIATIATVGQGEVCGVNHRVLCTQQLLALAAKGSWLALSEPIRTQSV